MAKQRLNRGPFPAGSIRETQVLVGVYQPELHKVPVIRAGGVYGNRRAAGTCPWEYLAYGDGLNPNGPAFVAEPARFRMCWTPAAGRGGRVRLSPRPGSIDVHTQP